jgi:hypothetical protein
MVFKKIIRMGHLVGLSPKNYEIHPSPSKNHILHCFTQYVKSYKMYLFYIYHILHNHINHINVLILHLHYFTQHKINLHDLTLTYLMFYIYTQNTSLKMHPYSHSGLSNITKCATRPPWLGRSQLGKQTNYLH